MRLLHSGQKGSAESRPEKDDGTLREWGHSESHNVPASGGRPYAQSEEWRKLDEHDRDGQAWKRKTKRLASGK